MSGAIPPIPPPFVVSSGNLAQSVVDENLPQLLDSKGGSHVTNVPAFDNEDFMSWKVREKNLCPQRMKETTWIRAFVAIAEDEPFMGKADIRSSQCVDITMKKVHRLVSMTDSDDRKHVLEYTHVDLIYVKGQRKNMSEVIRVNLENESLKDEIS
nr:hypothetical protein [Tanacetum cinerariifolium]